MRDDLEDIKRRLTAVEATTKNFRYLGPWETGRKYARGNFVTLGGSIWHANTETETRPGDGASNWTLAVKHGRDAR